MCALFSPEILQAEAVKGLRDVDIHHAFHPQDTMQDFSRVAL